MGKKRELHDYLWANDRVNQTTDDQRYEKTNKPQGTNNAKLNGGETKFLRKLRQNPGSKTK